MNRLLVTAMSALLTVPATAAVPESALTIYRNDSGALFEGGGSPIADGYAIVHEGRVLKLSDGVQTVVIDGLPSTLDAEAIAIELGSGARVLAQRVLAAGDSGLLAAHRGEKINVISASTTLSGTLLSLDGGGLVLRGDDGRIHYIRDYSSVQFVEGSGLPGATLQLSVNGSAGTQLAKLTYPTSGLGWRAAYSVLLESDTPCRARLDAYASIANRSGRDYPASRLKLIAGQPNIASSSGGGARPMMMKAMASEAYDGGLPEQTSLGDYRSFLIDAALQLPDASVTQVPLYASSDISCERSWIVENGSAWSPDKPTLSQGSGARSTSMVTSALRFSAKDNLPAGYLRVLTRDRDSQIEFLGENRVADTAKGQPVDITLGNAFDLVATRERTAFSVDRGAREMNESFRLTLSNTGDNARTVTVREHPNRWNNWQVASSSIKPNRKTPDLLEFQIPVAAGGKTTLDFSITYSWTAAQE